MFSGARFIEIEMTGRFHMIGPFTIDQYKYYKMETDHIRVSTEEQKLTGFSQRYPEEVLKTYCAVNSIEVDKIVFEDYSAKTFNRPAWNKLFAEYKNKRLSTPRLLLVTKWDRFSRYTGDAYYMIRQLDLLCIEVRAIELPLDITIPETDFNIKEWK